MCHIILIIALKCTTISAEALMLPLLTAYCQMGTLMTYLPTTPTLISQTMTWNEIHPDHLLTILWYELSFTKIN